MSCRDICLNLKDPWSTSGHTWHTLTYLLERAIDSLPLLARSAHIILNFWWGISGVTRIRASEEDRLSICIQVLASTGTGLTPPDIGQIRIRVEGMTMDDYGWLWMTMDDYG